MGILSRPTIVDTSEDCLLALANEIASAKDFARVEEKIALASKIRLGLKALNLAGLAGEYTDLTKDEEDRILVSLNHLCGVYNQQLIPLIYID